MRAWTPEQVAEAAGVEILGVTSDHGPTRAVIDSRDAGPGDLFVGIKGEHVDGGAFVDQALAQGAWGAIRGEDALAALQRLATAWRRELRADVIGVTGSTGKTSTKDVLAAMVAQQRPTVATRANFNTEIGLPLTILEAPPGTEVLVLEMAMRGHGQIAELATIAEPDVALITNIGPVHLEQMGSLEAIAAEKSAVIGGLRAGGTAVIPADEPLLEPHLRDDVTVVRFAADDDLRGLELPFDSAHMRLNAAAALAAARAVGVEPSGRIDVALSAMRGQRLELPGDVTIVNDCYNANPMSMRAALDDLASAAPGRRVAVLGDMLELGPDEERFHREIGDYARERGVDLVVTVGPRAVRMEGDHAVADAAEAAALLPELVEAGDTVLVKASRGVGLEVVADALQQQTA